VSFICNIGGVLFIDNNLFFSDDKKSSISGYACNSR
jgi:hypothetical protein